MTTSSGMGCTTALPVQVVIICQWLSLTEPS